MKKSEETTNKILETVVEMLKTNENITIKDICSKAYINIAAVNYHFGDKDTLITMAVQKVIVELKIKVSQLASMDFKSTEEALYLFVDLVFNFSTEYVGVMKYLLNSAPQSSGNRLLQQLFMDEEFTSFIFEKLQTVTGSDDYMKTMSKYVMLLSAFIFPMMCQYTFSSNFGGKIASISLNSEEFKKNYINQLLNILLG